jgi:alpha-ketoglutarate-dependent taurine dioxygenase
VVLYWQRELLKLTKTQVTRSIVGLKTEESDALLGFLLAHIGRGIDYQARIKWAPKTVVIWDVSDLFENIISILRD